MELLDSYLVHAERHYRAPNGKPTSELGEVKIVIRALVATHGDTLAIEFGPLALKAARQSWVTAGASRTECNRRGKLVKRIFKWAVSEELVPPSVHQGLATVAALKRGRTAAPELEPVLPVDDAIVDATLPFLNRHVRGMVQFQRFTGCRPGEACSLRMCDVDRTGAVWLYKVTEHKTAHHGKSRVVAIGPKAQTILAPFITDDPTAYLFNPKAAVAEIRAERAANRKTPLYPSHVEHNAKRRKANPKRAPKARYKRTSYTYAVARACDEAFPPPAPLARRAGETVKAWKARLTDGQKKELTAWRNRHGWAPNQLRHSFATKVRKMPGGGLEAVQVMLGHSRADVTQVYAEKNEALAASVASKIG